MECFEQEKVDNAKFPNLTKEVRYYKENTKGVSKMCQIVEEYAQEKADLQEAATTLKHVSNLMETCNMTEQQACKALKISQKAYKDAKRLLSKNEVLI